MKFAALLSIVSASLALAVVFPPQDQSPLGLNEDSISAQYYADLIDQWKDQDVVEVMKMAGFGEGLDEERLVQVFGEENPRVITEGEKLRLKKAGFSFMDITEHPTLGQLNSKRIRTSSAAAAFDTSKALVNAEQTRMMIQGLEDAVSYLRADITKLSSFWSRNYNSQWGLLSSNWVYSHVEELVSRSNLSTSVTKFSHKFPQNSVIARLETPSSDEKELIIIGAHQDSLNYRLPFFRAPGADDDGSGSVTLMHVLRSLVKNDFIPPDNIAVEFHWYAAEEGGLLGSQDIAASYEEEGKNVRAMLQMDMTAFVKTGTTPIIGFFRDATDKNLTSFCTKLVEEFIPLQWNMTGCGPRCGSDHMSWTKAGYPAAFATEGLFEDGPAGIHTEFDDMVQGGQYSFEHMVEFVKLGIAFITELSVA